MTDNELLLAIGNIMDKKLDSRLKPIENQIERLQSQMNNFEGSVSKLATTLKRIEIDLLENNVIPRMSSVEQHYVSASNRYMDSTEKIVSLESDVSILKKVVAEHSEKLQKIS